MADKETYVDEYQFVDPDSGSADAMDYTPGMDDSTQPEKPRSIIDKTFAGRSGVVRNVLIVLVLIIILMVIYPFLNSALTVKKKESMISSVPQPTKIVEHVASITPQPVVPVDSRPANVLNEQMSQKLSALEISQDRIQNDVASTNSQLSGINTNINEMMNKVGELNRIITLYSAKVDEQSREIEQLTAQANAFKKAHTPKPVKHTVARSSLKYYIQAVIPGRAWLSVSNGTTLTVREGTMIAGLGMVKLIDPQQGRVVISSGRIIRFSQEDS